MLKKRILVAPLNWGLGHATRCIPIINALLDNNFEPILASDGEALALLKKEFPKLVTIELPSYNIKYSKKGWLLKWKLLARLPHIRKTILKERKQIPKIIETFKICGIISDNRFGVYSKTVPSVYITHQLQVLSGFTTFISSAMHQYCMSKFTECWVPDIAGNNNLSGKLSRKSTNSIPIKYIGFLSRFKKTDSPFLADLLVLLSGPEPQRTILEKQVLQALKAYKGKVVFVKGVVEQLQTITKKENITLYNYMTTAQLESTINGCNVVLSRSGYTTIMDLVKLEKKAFFVPTPGQQEQEYLAKRLENLGHVLYCKQKDFSINKLNNIDLTTGFCALKAEVNYKKLFSLF
ncbi:MAG: glycosyltransferase [Oceanihabitans sp.]